MPKHKIIIESTGTPFGMSILSNVAWGCVRYEWFKALAEQEEKRLAEETPDEGQPQNYKYTSVGLLTGSIGHGILDAFYNGYELDDLEIEVPGYAPDLVVECKAKAMNACESYTLLHPRKEVGRVIETEQLYETELFGMPYSFRPDLVTKIGKRASLKLLDSRRVDIEPGLWQWDYKFLSALNGNYVDWYINGFSGPSYVMGWNKCHGAKEQVKGLIFCFISTAKNPKQRVLTHVQYGVNGVQKKRLERTFQLGREKGFPIDPNDPMPAGDLSKCHHQTWGACRWYVDGRCPRF